MQAQSSARPLPSSLLPDRVIHGSVLVSSLDWFPPFRYKFDCTSELRCEYVTRYVKPRFVFVSVSSEWSVSVVPAGIGGYGPVRDADLLKNTWTLKTECICVDTCWQVSYRFHCTRDMM